MHDRISVSEVSSWNWTLDEDLAFYDRAGVDNVGVAFRKLQATGDAVAAAGRVLDAGLRVTNLLVQSPFPLDQPENWSQYRDQIGLVMDTALALRPELMVFTTGPAGRLPWERAADAFEEVMQGTILESTREDLPIAIEHTNSLRTDVGFVHTLRDAIELAWRLGVFVCLEVNACWAERNLGGTITAGIDAIGIVQVSDYAIGTHTTPDRLVPGDGDIPLGRIVGQLLDAGYGGVFDLEIIGPRIEAEGYETAIERSIAAVQTLIEPPADDPEQDEPDSEGDSYESAASDAM